MAVDVYFREDIAQVLSAVDLASGGTAALVNEELEKATCNGQQPDGAALADHLRIYRQGYKAALAAVATAFGVLPAPENVVVSGMRMVRERCEADVRGADVVHPWPLNRHVPV